MAENDRKNDITITNTLNLKSSLKEKLPLYRSLIFRKFSSLPRIIILNLTVAVNYFHSNVYLGYSELAKLKYDVDFDVNIQKIHLKIATNAERIKEPHEKQYGECSNAIPYQVPENTRVSAIFAS